MDPARPPGADGRLRPDQLPAVALRLLIPLAFLAFLLLTSVFLHPNGRYRTVWGFMAALWLSPLGKFTAIAMVQSGFGILETILFLSGTDIFFGMLIILNFDLLYAIPRLGPWVRRLEDKGRIKLFKRPWVRRLAFTGVLLWSAVPIQGTGSISGAIFARLIGMGTAKAMLAITIGSVLGIGLISSTTVGLRLAFTTGIDFGLYATVVLTCIVYILWAGYWAPWRPAPEKPSQQP